MLAEGYDVFLFDLDGVLYRSDQPIPGAAEALARLRELGKRIAFVTNNSSRLPDEVSAKLLSVGVAAEPHEIVTSALVTAELLADRGVRSVYVIGGVGLRSELSAAGIELVDGDAAAVDAVVVGFDRGVDYERLRVASVLVEKGASLVASNGDASFPASDGWNWPGAGALVAAVETTTGARAEVIGKPHPPLLLAALDRAGGGVPLLVGDRIDTDIAGAAGLGWASALVLTGVTTRVQALQAAPAPTYVLDDLLDLLA